MSTDHTSGSSWEAASDSAAHQAYVIPAVSDADAAGVDAPNASQHDASQHNASQHDASQHDGLDQQDQLPTGDSAQPPADSTSESESASEALRDSLKAADVGAIEFRVIRPGTPVRRLRLTGNRYTFGSAEGCSIRLTDHGLRPMHAVLIRDASRILVRAYSVPVQVNGTRTTEATLQFGDVLKLGAYQFELLDAKQRVIESATNSPVDTHPFRSIFDVVGSRSSKSPTVGEGPFERSTSTSADDLIWKEKLRREVEQWRERQVECDRRENRIDERETTLRDRESELWSRAENLYRRESRLQSQEAAAFQLYDEFTKRQQELIDLREAAHRRQETFHQRETAFRNQELEYRERLDEASRQLHQSQQQAESATQAVQRMREQFDSLNLQIEQLSSQHTQIEQREGQHREDHENLRAELEKSRDKAIDGQTESDAKRRDAESRLEELESHLEALQDGRCSDLEALQAKFVEREQTADDLRRQVDHLQQNLADATEESTRLKADYEDAFASVVKLESMIAQNSERGDKDREGWETEAEELRAAGERLSMELTRANRELSELRDANEQLTTRLDDMQRQRDETRTEIESRPTSDALSALQDDLTVATQQLSQVREDFEATQQQLDQTRQDHQRDQEQAAIELADAIAALDAVQTMTQGNPVADVDTKQLDTKQLDTQPTDTQPTDTQPTDTEQTDTEQFEDIWESEHTVTETTDYDVVDIVDEFKADSNFVEDGQRDVESASSIWPASNALHQDDVENVDHSEPTDDSDRPDDGALARLLIKDLDEDSERGAVGEPQSLSVESDQEYASEEPMSLSWDEPTADSSWDQEHREEAYASEWSNDPDGYRVENIDCEAQPIDAETEEVLPAEALNDDEQPIEAEILAEEQQDEFDSVLDDDPEHALELDRESDIEGEACVDPVASRQTPFEPTAAPGVEDDSIEAYMNRLLRRVQGEPLADALEPVTEPVTELSAAADQDSLDQQGNESDADQDVDTDAPLVARSAAPEKTTSLSAMRELANTSARIAISRSVRVQTRDTQIKAMVSFASAAGAVMCGAACFYFIPGVMRYVGVAMTVIVAAIYLREGTLLFRDASRTMKAAEQGAADDVAQDVAITPEELSKEVDETV